MADEPVEPTAAATPPAEPAATGADATEGAPVPPPPPADEVVEAELVETSETPVAEQFGEFRFADVAEGAAAPQYVVVEAPRPPRKHGNRGIGTILALLGAAVFGLLLVGATYLLGVASGAQSVDFLAQWRFYLPIEIFAIAFILLVIVLNRAAWWAYVLGSLVVGLIVYFGTAGASAVIDYVQVQLGWLQASSAASFEQGLQGPFVPIAAVLAHEVAIWWGAIIAHRGRRMTAKNRLARETFDEQLAEFHAKYGRAAG